MPRLRALRWPSRRMGTTDGLGALRSSGRLRSALQSVSGTVCWPPALPGPMGRPVTRPVRVLARGVWNVRSPLLA